MQLQEIIIVPHSHTDLGFTHDQPIVDELHGRFLKRAMELCETTSDAAEGECFCWTVEVCGVLKPWLQRASDQDIARLQSLEKRGLIEIGAMPLHFTPLADKTDLQEAFRWVVELREKYGLTITSALNSDVNGQNWPVVDVMLDHGIIGYSAAINTHFGRAPFTRPNIFLWKGPSGRTIPAFNGFPYGYPGKLGLTDAASNRFADKWLSRLEAHLAEVGWPLPVIMLQAVHPFGDNAGPHFAPVEFARTWNASGRLPRITIGTPRTWWQRVEKFSPNLEIVRGDWTDFWNFGSLATARDLAVSRRVRLHLRQTDSLQEIITNRGLAAPQSLAEYRSIAWGAYLRWMEHTWTADCGAEAPFCEDVVAQSAHKAAALYQSRSLSLLLRRDALMALAEAEGGQAGDLLLVNRLPWPRTIAGWVAPGVGHPRGIPGDSLAGAHFQDRKADLDPLDLQEVPEMPWKQYPEYALPPTEVPAMTTVLVPRTRLRDQSHTVDLDPKNPVENDFFRIVVDPVRGGITSLIEQASGREWVETNSPWHLHEFVRESLAPAESEDTRWPRDRIFSMNWGADAIEVPNGWQTDWPARREHLGPVREHRVVRSTLGLHILQWLQMGPRERGLRQEVFLPNHAPWIECRSRWMMEPESEPQAHYLIFPFALEGATLRVDLGGAVIRPGTDQLPGCCHDYFTAQNWVDLSNTAGGVTVALPENPLVQFGDFSFGQARMAFQPGPATLLGWVTANYWHCNFPAFQPGWVRSRYRLLFHQGFEEAAAHRFATEAAEERPLLHAF